MKKYILALLFLLIPSICFGAIAATTVWEIQQDATANNVNGGGFNPSNASPGTDRSQTTAAFDSGTDLASADGDAIPCVITSASHNFDADDHGNIIHITAGTGWTVGWYEIVSTSGNAATLDRACGTDGAKTNGTWYLGGAMSLNSTLDSEFFAQLIAGNTVYIKYNASAIAMGETMSVSSHGTALLPINIVGYNTTRTLTNVDASRPTINIAANGWTGGNYWRYKNLIFTMTMTDGMTLGSYGNMENCKATNSSGTADRTALNGSSGFIILNSEVASTNGIAVKLGGGAKLIGSYVHDSKNCVNLLSTYGVVWGNIISGCTTAGITITATYDYQFIAYNTLNGNAVTPAGTGIITTDSEVNFIFGNIIANWATGINWNADTKINYLDYNNFYNNTTAHRTNITTTGPNNLDDTDPSFTNVGAGDFSVGTSMKAKGLPGVFPGELSTGYLDLGAVQRIEPAAGGGGAWAY